MELWIRTQDRAKLLIVKELELQMLLYRTEVSIWGGTENNCFLLGRYKDKERALQVLDTIQNILNPVVIMKEPKTEVENNRNFIQTLTNEFMIKTTQQIEYDLKEAGQFVYNMPEE